MSDFLEVHGLKKLRRAFKYRTRSLLGHIRRELLSDVKDLVISGVRTRFASESDLRSAWTQLAIRTQRERKRQGYPPKHPILIRTGALFDKLTKENSRNYATRHEGDSVRFVARLTTLKEQVLHFGGKRVPSRKFMGLIREEKDEIKIMSTRFLNNFLITSYDRQAD